MIRQGESTFARVWRHFVAYCLTAILCFWFNEIYKLANPNLVAPALLGIISALVMYDAGGFRALRLWTHRREESAQTTTEQTTNPDAPSVDASAGSGRAE